MNTLSKWLRSPNKANVQQQLMPAWLTNEQIHPEKHVPKTNPKNNNKSNHNIVIQK